MKEYDGLALFSGGLDSILAVKVLQEQGKKILCLHFTSPFFGDKRLVEKWEKDYDLEIEVINIDDKFCKMLIQGGRHGYGSALNPCIDCKILMMQEAKALMPKYGAKFLVSGEVLGQRPMSQRRDTLNVIHNDAGVKGILLRPLCAKHFDPTALELSGEIDRDRLLNFSGRGRKDQLALAKKYNIVNIPAPAGGCKLTEKENTRRYWKLIQEIENPNPFDFELSHWGRQFWYDKYWLVVGRNQADNNMLQNFTLPTDYVFKVSNFAGPLGVGRLLGERPTNMENSTWERAEILRACAHLASYCGGAVKFHQENNKSIVVKVNHGNNMEEHEVIPFRDLAYSEPNWEETHKGLIAIKKRNHGQLVEN